MADFFFDTDHLTSTEADTPLALENSGAAYLAALAALPCLARDVIPEGRAEAVGVTVRDASGKPICKVSLHLRVQWLG
ncbi:DUF6894 family protein [Muricoccus aerilatus]|uniref:DUF6894 family protein n=1 Tax=Muricoccus aerilatus TaxID=452982 RepID=UPI0012EBEB32|nr:hypothetical protein [Roseomonas aerilata]